MSEKRSEQRERLTEWVDNLRHDQKDSLLVELVIQGIDSEMISFWDDSQFPYWSHTGDSIVDGQDE